MAERNTESYNQDLYDLHAHLIENYDVKFDNITRRQQFFDPYIKPTNYSKTNLGPYMELVEESLEEHESEHGDEEKEDQDEVVEEEDDDHHLDGADNSTETDNMTAFHIKFQHIPTIWDHNYTRFLPYENISMYLNGYMRVVKFQVTNQDYHQRFNALEKSKLNRLQPELLFITEGQFQNGSLNGFGRRLFKNEQCQIGYWRDNEPYGKF